MRTIKDTDPKNIIVRMPNWVGDLVMATSVLSDLKRIYPYATLSVLAQEGVYELLKNDKDIDKLYCLKKQKGIFFNNKENLDIILELKKTTFDYGILLTNSLSSAYFFHRAGIKNSIGYKKYFRNFLLKNSIELIKDNVHQIIKYKNLLNPLGIEISDTNPRLYFDSDEVKNVKNILYQKGFNDNKTLIGINPLARYGSAKCWPIDRFKEVAARLAQDKKNTIVFIGDRFSKDLIKKVCFDLPSNVINLAGDTTLRELMCIIKLCNLFITNDSGPMHLASALDIPLIALFGSTSDLLTGPYNEKAIVINKKVECAPCFKRKCPSDFKCMHQISVDEVINKIHEILNENFKKN